MSLLSDAMEKCAFINAAIVDDGRGSNITTYTEGGKFYAAFELQNSLNEAVAMAQGVKGVYRVTTERDVRLEFHQIFKRLSDNKTFRVDSKDDSHTPETANLNMRVVRAEEWEVPV